MGGCSTIGYENTDGSVSYAYECDDQGPEYLIDYIKKEPLVTTKYASSINEYFSDELSELEDSKWRLLCCLDGTGIASCGDGGELIWRPVSKK